MRLADASDPIEGTISKASFRKMIAQKSLCLVGEKGMGKSSLCEHIAEEAMKMPFDMIIYFHLGKLRELDMCQAIDSLIRSGTDEDPIIDLLKGAKSILLIADDYHKLALYKELSPPINHYIKLCEEQENAICLLTTRRLDSALPAFLANMHVLHIMGFQPNKKGGISQEVYDPRVAYIREHLSSTPALAKLTHRTLESYPSFNALSQTPLFLSYLYELVASEGSKVLSHDLPFYFSKYLLLEKLKLSQSSLSPILYFLTSLATYDSKSHYFPLRS